MRVCMMLSDMYQASCGSSGAQRVGVLIPHPRNMHSSMKLAMQGLRRHLAMPISFAMPICHIPGGSGNGLSATCGLWNLVTAVHALIKGSVQAMDAASVFLASESVPRLSILGVQYGLLANLDLGTEHLRKLLGGERFTYGAIREVMKWQKHKANIAFCKEPASEVNWQNTQHGCVWHLLYSASSFRGRP